MPHRVAGLTSATPLRYGALSLISWSGDGHALPVWLARETLACLLLPAEADGREPLRYWPASDDPNLASAALPGGTLIAFSLLSLQLHLPAVAAEARTRAPLDPALLRSREIPLVSPDQLFVLQVITEAINLIREAGVVAPSTALATLELDGLVLRSTALLLLPPGAPTADLVPLTLQRAVDQAMAWMLTHLDCPISLADLEEQVRYSRRSLQLGFRQRVGCGPIQWWRRQRLRVAHDAIAAMPNGQRGVVSLAAVARCCGYSTTASLSRDFSALYGYSPSWLLRQS